jgi:hypothetical protein
LRKISELLFKKIDNISIVITPLTKNKLPETKFKKIVILTGDEQGNAGLTTFKDQDVLLVFRIFNKPGWYDNKYIFPIPPGYNWTMHNNSDAMVDMYPDKLIKDRKMDIFYSGQPLPLRMPLVNKLNVLKSKFQIYNNITPSFRTGLNIDEYYKMLGDAKISVCPDGTSIDTFRYVESFGSGCVVITTNKDKNIWYYEKSPAIFLNNWDELTEDLINKSLKNGELREKGLKYYQDYLSEDAVANYIYDKIKNKI